MFTADVRVQVPPRPPKRQSKGCLFFCQSILAKTVKAPDFLHESSQSGGFLHLLGNLSLFATIATYFSDLGRRHVGAGDGEGVSAVFLFIYHYCKPVDSITYHDQAMRIEIMVDYSGDEDDSIKDKTLAFDRINICAVSDRKKLTVIDWECA